VQGVLERPLNALGRVYAKINLSCRTKMPQNELYFIIKLVRLFLSTAGACCQLIKSPKSNRLRNLHNKRFQMAGRGRVLPFVSIKRISNLLIDKWKTS